MRTRSKQQQVDELKCFTVSSRVLILLAVNAQCSQFDSVAQLEQEPGGIVQHGAIYGPCHVSNLKKAANSLHLLRDKKSRVTVLGISQRPNSDQVIPADCVLLEANNYYYFVTGGGGGSKQSDCRLHKWKSANIISLIIMSHNRRKQHITESIETVRKALTTMLKILT